MFPTDDDDGGGMCVLIVILFGNGNGERISGPPASENGGVRRVNAFEGIGKASVAISCRGFLGWNAVDSSGLSSSSSCLRLKHCGGEGRYEGLEEGWWSM